MDNNRRNLLKGLIAAPAILKLGIHMPVKTIIIKAEEFITLTPKEVAHLVNMITGEG